MIVGSKMGGQFLSGLDISSFRNPAGMVIFQNSNLAASRPTGGDSAGAKRCPTVLVTSTTISLRPRTAAFRKSKRNGGQARKPTIVPFIVTRVGKPPVSIVRCVGGVSKSATAR